MIEKIFITSALVFAVHYVLQEGEIFGWLGDLLAKILPDKLHDPFFECVVCMAGIYGALIYWIIWHVSVKEWLVINLSAIGLNAIINQLTPDKELALDNQMDTKIIDAFNGVSVFDSYFEKRNSEEKWKILFDYYNSKSDMNPLSLSCMQCYRKVYEFILSEITTQSIKPK